MKSRMSYCIAASLLLATTTQAFLPSFQSYKTAVAPLTHATCSANLGKCMSGWALALAFVLPFYF